MGRCDRAHHRPRTVSARGWQCAGLPVRVLGTGPPVVLLPGLSFTHAPPSGATWLWERVLLRRLARHLELHWMGRRTAVPEGYTMAEFAADYANALSTRFSRPVPVLGFSTGGFLGMQLAADHPDLVERLVVAGAGHTLSEAGRGANLRWIEALTGGRPGDAWRELAADAVGSDRPRALVGRVLAAVGPLVTPADCVDGIRTAAAETHFDVGPSLPRISAPTLLVAGDRDANCTTELLLRTARGVPGARLEILPGVTHMGALSDPAAARTIAAFLRQ